jgi:hypothetical protein
MYSFRDMFAPATVISELRASGVLSDSTIYLPKSEKEVVGIFLLTSS